MKIKRFMILACALAAMGFFSMPAQAQEIGYRVIVHPDNPASSISKNDLSRFLLKKKKRWDHGVPVDPVDLDSKSAVRATFTKDVHGRSVSSIKNFWQRQIFSGREVPPPEVASDAAVIAHVQSNPGGIGYVSASAQLDGVKEIAISN